MPNRAEIVAYAHSLEGTPFRHQGRLPGVGLDCAGLIECVANHFGLTPVDFRWEAYDTFPQPAFVLRKLNDNLIHVGGLRLARPGDVGLISDSGHAVHLGIFAERDGDLTVIHSSRLLGGVVEHRVDAAFSRLIRGVWRYQGVTG